LIGWSHAQAKDLREVAADWETQAAFSGVPNLPWTYLPGAMLLIASKRNGGKAPLTTFFRNEGFSW
jgi:hypothetical protein